MGIVDTGVRAAMASPALRATRGQILWRTIGSSLAVTLLFSNVAGAEGGVFKGEIRLADHGPKTAPWVAETVVQIRLVPSPEAEPAKVSGEKTQIVVIRKGVLNPDVLAVPRGTEVRFVNQDEKIHNIVSSSPTKKFDLGMLAAGESGSVVFDQPGVVRVGCKAEPTMESYVVVTEGKQFAVGDERGLFEIQGVPPGSYVAEAWNPHYETVSQRISIDRDGQVVTTNLKFTTRRAVPWP